MQISCANIKLHLDLSDPETKRLPAFSCLSFLSNFFKKHNHTGCSPSIHPFHENSPAETTHDLQVASAKGWFCVLIRPEPLRFAFNPVAHFLLLKHLSLFLESFLLRCPSFPFLREFLLFSWSLQHQGS